MRRLFVLSLCRNVEATVVELVQKVSAACDFCNVVPFFIFGEDGSTDHTLERLNFLRGSGINISYFDTSFMQDEPERLRRMALGREFLMSKLPSAYPHDLILVLDIDLEFSLSSDFLAFDGLLNELDEADCVGVSFFSSPVMYDLLAYSSARYVNFALLNYQLRILSYRYAFLFPFLLLPRVLFRFFVVLQQKLLGSGAGTSCISAFNGGCLYRREYYDCGTYLSKSVVCEHFTFNYGLFRRFNRGIYVSGSVGVIAPSEHLKGPFALIYFKIRSGFRQIFSRGREIR